MKIAEIKELKDDTAVETLTGTVTHVENKISGKGNPYLKVKLSDDTGNISVLVLNGQSPVAGMIGRSVNFVGNMKKGSVEYQGKHYGNVTAFKDCLIAQSSDDQLPGMPTTPANAAPAHSSVIHGATVGMAINKSVDAFIALGDTTKKWTRDEFKAYIWATASDLVRIAQAMEQGKLAPKEGEEESE